MCVAIIWKWCNSPSDLKVFSDGFSEGQTKDIRSGFPTELSPYTEDYDYMSDSDLEDGEDEPNDEGGLNLQRPGDMEDIHNSHSDASHNPSPPPSSIGAVDAQNDRSSPSPLDIRHLVHLKSQCLQQSLEDRQGCYHSRYRSRDVRTVCLYIFHCTSLANCSFQAFLYFLYSGDIHFALLSSDPRQNLPAQARVGDWITGKLPSPSAKSIYRLADKVTNIVLILIPLLTYRSTIYQT